MQGLSHGFDTIEVIESAILPGNRAPRGRSVMASISEEPCPPLFPSILKSDFDTLAPEVQRTHQIHDLEQFSGEAKVTRGTNPLARVIAAIFRSPPASGAVPV